MKTRTHDTEKASTNKVSNMEAPPGATTKRLTKMESDRCRVEGREENGIKAKGKETKMAKPTTQAGRWKVQQISEKANKQYAMQWRKKKGKTEIEREK